MLCYSLLFLLFAECDGRVSVRHCLSCSVDNEQMLTVGVSRHRMFPVRLQEGRVGRAWRFGGCGASAESSLEMTAVSSRCWSMCLACVCAHVCVFIHYLLQELYMLVQGVSAMVGSLLLSFSFWVS